MKFTDTPAKVFDSNGATDSSGATEARDPVTGRFLSGFRGSSVGRKKGARARWSEEFMADIEAAWKDQGRSVIDRAMFHDPAGTLKALIGILPKHAKLEISTPVDGMTDEQLERLIAYAEAKVGEGVTIEGSMRNVTPPPALAALDPEPSGHSLEAPSRHPGRDAEGERRRRDLLDQANAAQHAETATAPAPVLPHPVGRPFPRPPHDEQRRNLAKLHDDIDPASLF